MRSSKNKFHTFGICAAFDCGYRLADFILNLGCKIEFIATCESDDTVFVDRIRNLALGNGITYHHKININSDHFITLIKSNPVDIGFLCWWPKILKPNIIKAPLLGWVNLHPSLLPYGRGKHAYFWSLVENYPLGATIHFVDSGIDTGPILYQSKIETNMTDTGESLYKKCVENALKLFREKFPKIIRGEFKTQKQNNKKYSTRSSKEIEEITTINLNEKYKAIELINIIRARTFSEGKCSKFELDGKTYQMKLYIEEV